MNWLQRLYGPSIGKKAVMAVTGVILLAFTIVHLIGNLQVYLGRERFNAYAAFLKGTPALLWTVRILLLLAALLHIVAALQLWLRQRQARPIPYERRGNVQSSWASRTMRYSGLVLLFFVIYHLLHFTTGHAHPTYPNFDPADVYGNFVAGFRVVPVSIFYIAAMLALGLHLMHGAWSFVQTLGLRPAYDRTAKSVALGLTAVLVLGNVSMPVAVMAGIVR